MFCTVDWSNGFWTVCKNVMRSVYMCLYMWIIHTPSFPLEYLCDVIMEGKRTELGSGQGWNAPLHQNYTKPYFLTYTYWFLCSYVKSWFHVYMFLTCFFFDFLSNRDSGTWHGNVTKIPSMQTNCKLQVLPNTDRLVLAENQYAQNLVIMDRA